MTATPIEKLLLSKQDTYKHAHCSVVWSPRVACTFASSGADGALKLWDTRHPRPATVCSFNHITSHRITSRQVIHAHDYEVLTCDWSKYSEHTLFSGSVDKTIKGTSLMTA